jgi:hypothetical protein
MQHRAAQFREPIVAEFVRTLSGGAEKWSESDVNRDSSAGASMNPRLTIALALLTGGLASRVEAIEMFTNFNNGTELGTRPYGIEVLSPVRYHAYPHGRWFQGPMPACGPSGDVGKTPAASPALQSNAADPLVQRSPAGADSPIIVRPAETTARRNASNADDTWIRSSNFILPAQAE